MASERAAVDRTSHDLRVFISNRESSCDDCGDDLGRHAMIVLAGDRVREEVDRVLSGWRKR